MYPLFESLALLDGEVQNLHYHILRYTKAYEEYYGYSPKIGLLENLNLALPDDGLYKLKVEYSDNGKKASCSKYSAKSTTSLKMVNVCDLDYHLKYTDRTALNKLYDSREMCDDVLIINDDLISDTSIGNILFFKEGKWYTPNTPLLEGTQRAKLLEEKIIIEKLISLNSIKEYEGFQVINAMRPFSFENKQDINKIIS